MKKKQNVTSTKSKREKFADTGQIIVAVLLVLLAIPVMGVVWVKDSLQNPSYCAGCHEDPYYISWAEGSDEDYSLAHQHAQMGISCQTCHDRTLGESLTEVVNYVTGNYYYPFEETQLSMETCFTCHVSYEKIIPLTSTAITKEERNPHAGHWGELECGECHNMHRDSVVYCDGCHDPITEGVPGWVQD